MFDPFNAGNDHKLMLWERFVSLVVLALSVAIMVTGAVWAIAVGNWLVLVAFAATPLGIISIVGLFAGLAWVVRRTISGDWSELELVRMDLRIARLERRVAKASARRSARDA